MSDTTRVSTANCAAFGCKMLGTMSRSTTGGDWLCHVHFGADSDRWQIITAELNQLGWMVDGVRAIRELSHAPKFKAVAKKINASAISAQREDLKLSDRETVQQWGIRLETVLAQSCATIGTQHEIFQGEK